jgi:acyl carrier protein
MTAVEIAALICELVEIDDMGVDDDFFRVGGRSWGALMLMMRLEERSGVKISLLEVFQARTPSQLAALIADRSATPSVPK